MKCLSFLIGLTLSTLAAAAPYQLKGAYYFHQGDKNPVSFNLKWVEKDGKVTGLYSDNRFTDEALVKGRSSDTGRTFEIVLPVEKSGVKSFLLLTSSAGPKETGKSIPLQIVTRDMNGNPLQTARFEAQFSEQTSRSEAQAQEARPCTEGFGELSGFCGRYGGMLTEEYDSGKECDFVTEKNVRLEMDNEANVIFHTNHPQERYSSEDHLIGRIPSDTQTKTVDLMSRQCRPLPGTNFPGDDCKRLNLIGTFTSRNGHPHFNGTYSIIDEKNDKSCRYSMTMDLVDRI
jgi:hypothetical protein